MDILTIFRSFKTQEQCIAYLEKIRWRGEPHCPYCAGTQVSRHASKDRAIPRWQCQYCNRAFAVTVGTIFHGTHVPLQQWFLLIGLMLNAKKSASACQIARDLGMRRPTVWSMMHRVRVAMAEDQDQNRLLHGLVEADETYIGGKPRKSNKRPPRPNPGGKRGPGRGTAKMPILGAIERGGQVVAKASNDGVGGKTIQKFIEAHVDKAGTLLVTDQWGGYRRVGQTMNWAFVNHSERYVDGIVHTNTIESFWALLKRAWYGQHHHYSKDYTPLYVSEACFKYNHRKGTRVFEKLIGVMVAA